MAFTSIYVMCAGGVLLLTAPVSAGYTQNPISVYYCKAAGGELQRCTAEVTNTPWGERVTFLFDPEGQEVPKAMHVSPLMDMKSTWCGIADLEPRFCRERKHSQSHSVQAMRGSARQYCSSVLHHFLEGFGAKQYRTVVRNVRFPKSWSCSHESQRHFCCWEVQESSCGL